MSDSLLPALLGNGKGKRNVTLGALLVLGIYLGELRAEVAQITRRLDTIERYIIPHTVVPDTVQKHASGTGD